MSVVAARVTPAGVIIASDSITVLGYTQRKDGGKHVKLFRSTSDIIVGGVGLAEESSMMAIFLETHKLAGASAADVLHLMHDFTQWKKEMTDKAEVTNSFLLGYSGRLFSTNGWHVDEVTTFDAIGAGADFALAALHLGHSPHDAVAVAIELSVFCEGPIIDMTQSVI